MEERNYFTPPLTLANVVWKFFSFKCDGGFPPQIRGLIFDSRTRPRSLFLPRTIYFQLYPHSRITIYNWEGRMFLTWDESLFSSSFFSFINFFCRDEIHSCSSKIKRKISLLFIHLRGGEEADRS